METSGPYESQQQMLGWGFVAVQATLLIALILLPRGDAWPTSGPLDAMGAALVVLGLVVIVVAALRLGPALTPTPMPTKSGALVASGLYRFVRHPIYGGVLAVVVGLTIRSGSLVTLAVGAITVGFFNLKARWEETRLAERYPDYPAYAAATPRFVPNLWPNRSEEG